jgi:hypothetical protein
MNHNNNNNDNTTMLGSVSNTYYPHATDQIQY